MIYVRCSENGANEIETGEVDLYLHEDIEEVCPDRPLGEDTEVGRDQLLQRILKKFLLWISTRMRWVRTW